MPKRTDLELATKRGLQAVTVAGFPPSVETVLGGRTPQELQAKFPRTYQRYLQVKDLKKHIRRKDTRFSGRRRDEGVRVVVEIDLDFTYAPDDEDRTARITFDEKDFAAFSSNWPANYRAICSAINDAIAKWASGWGCTWGGLNAEAKVPPVPGAQPPLATVPPSPAGSGGGTA